MKTNGIEALGAQIERLAKESKNWEIAYYNEMETSKKATSDKIISERERDEWRGCIAEMNTTIANQAEQITELKSKQAPSHKVGTWAWACEMAFKNPGKRYTRGEETPEQTMIAKNGFLRDGDNDPFAPTDFDVIATDWREVTP